MWFIVNCRLRIKAREQGGLLYILEQRVDRPGLRLSQREPEGIIWYDSLSEQVLIKVWTYD